MFRWHKVLVFAAVGFVPLFASTSSFAYPIRVNFTVSGDPTDPALAGVSSTGYFTFDSSIIPYGGGMIWSSQPPGLQILSVSFNWGGHAWTTDDTFCGILKFAEDGSLIGFNLQAKLTPNYVGGGNYPDFSIDVNPSSWTFAYELTSDRGYQGGLTTWDAATLPIMVGAWQGGEVQLALDSFGRVYAYDEPASGQLGNVTVRGNLFNGPPPSPVVSMEIATGGNVYATLQNGDIWQLPGGSTTGVHVGNIFSAPGIAAVAVGAPGASNSLALPRPNPFNPRVEIPYRVASSGHVTARVYDISGRLVRTVEDGTRVPGGYTARWDGATDSGTAAASGTYFFRLTFPDGTHSEQKLTILR